MGKTFVDFISSEKVMWVVWCGQGFDVQYLADM